MRVIFSWLGFDDLLKFSKAYPAFENDVNALFRKYPFDKNSVCEATQQCFYSQLYLFHHTPFTFEKELRCWLGPHAELISLNLKDHKKLASKAMDKILELTNGFRSEYGVILDGRYLSCESAQQPNAWLYELNNSKLHECVPSGMDKNACHSALKPCGFEHLTCSEPNTMAIIQHAATAAKYMLPVLITGERGTGKSTLAEAMSGCQKDSNHLIERVNSITANDETFEKYLLGADGTIGILNKLEGGTLFLDEIDSFSPAAQLTLWKVLCRYKAGKCEFSSGQGQITRTSKFKILASAKNNLQAMVNEDRFLPDLFYLLAGISLETIPLRERSLDLELMVHEFIQMLNHEHSVNDTYKTLSSASWKALRQHSWSGNIDELKRVLTQAYIFSRSDIIDRNDLPIGTHHQRMTPKTRNAPLEAKFNLNAQVNELQKDYINRAMTQANGKKSLAAKLLGLKSYQTLDSRMKALGMND